MCAISASELLDVWEAGHALSPVQRALALLMAALPDASPPVLAEMSIGQRDVRLLSLRERLFGSSIVAVADCPNCAERVEMTFDVADVHTAHEVADERNGREVFEVRVAGYVVQARAVNSLDVMHAIEAQGSVDLALIQQTILARCLIEARRGKKQIRVEDLPDSVIGAVAQRMSDADPQADVQIALRCPKCGHEWQALFDVATFLWREIDRWAHRTLSEVHTLATAYGWRESDILAMSASRREHYLGMIGHER